ncbi:MAG: hypothetical protein Q4C56_04045 [Peptococcaceae bacterium]|nr:hypothetical protein [Peptococcaceae bacterium]
MNKQLTWIAYQKLERLRNEELPHRAFRVANELRNAEMDVLAKGGRGGRVYRIPGTRKYYTASAPGEVPAVRTGVFRLSWRPKHFRIGDEYQSRIESSYNVGGYNLGALLENGSPRGQLAPRPHHEKILERAKPKALKIYREPYF